MNNVIEVNFNKKNKHGIDSKYFNENLVRRDDFDLLIKVMSEKLELIKEVKRLRAEIEVLKR